MQEVFRAIGRLSRSSMTVLITGESGTGKELVARALHRHSPRAREGVHRAQHVRVHRGPAGVRAVRPREGLVHRRGSVAARALRTGRRRHAVSRRDRRHVAAAADAAAARAGGRRVLSRRRTDSGARRRARDRSDAPGSGRARAAGPVPRRPATSAQRDPHRSAAAALAPRGHSGVADALPRRRGASSSAPNRRR